MIDTEIMTRVDRMRTDLGVTEQGHEFLIRRALVPYSLVMQTIVEEVARGR